MNFYQTLGVADTASGDEIKRAYRSLAKKYHPDANPNNKDAELKFKQAAEAYEVLSDASKKAHYDAQLRGQAAGFSGGFGGFDYGTNFDNIVENLFADLQSPIHAEIAVNVPFLETRFPQQKEISYTRSVTCAACSGSGAKIFNSTACHSCNGNGQVKQSHGFFTAVQICHACKGRGRQILEVCPLCHSGQVNETAQVKITVPAGIYTGQVLKVAGEGHRVGKARGDLRIRILVDSDPRWDKREGPNVYSTAEVPYTKLVLGGSMVIETIWGPETINIPPRTKCGEAIALTNRGFPRLNGVRSDERGNHFVTFDLKMPTNITPEYQEMLKKLESLA